MYLLIRITPAVYCARAVPGGLATASWFFIIRTGCRVLTPYYRWGNRGSGRESYLLTARKLPGWDLNQGGFSPKHVLLSLYLLEMLPTREVRERPISLLRRHRLPGGYEYPGQIL